MKTNICIWLACLAGVIFHSTLYASITSVTNIGGTYAPGDTIQIEVALEGGVVGGSAVNLTMVGNDIYGNEINFVVASVPAPALAPAGPNVAAETDTVSLSWTIPQDGTLHNITTGYSFTVTNGSSGAPAGTVFIEAAVNIGVVSLTYEAGTYEGKDIIEVTYQVANVGIPPTAVRPLVSDSYRCRIFLTPNPRYDASEDFRLGWSDFDPDSSLGLDGYFFIPNGDTDIRSIVTQGGTPNVDTYSDPLGRSYQPQPDDGVLDVGEYMTVRQQFLIPTNFTGTYFLGVIADALEEIDESNETDNLYVSDSTPRIRIISGPASLTLPVSEVTDSDGNQVAVANDYSDEPSINEEGNLIAFQSFATNLTPDDDFNYNGLNQIFLRNVSNNAIRLLSQSIGGLVGNGTSINPSISANGRYVAFESTSSNLVNGDTNGFSDIFVRDIELNSTVRLTVNVNGVQANGASFSPTISESGRFVAFESVASNLDPSSPVIPGAGTGRIQIYVVDRDIDNSGTFDRAGNVGIYLVSVNNAGQLADENVLNPVLSLDGNSLVYVTDASNFPSSNGFDQIYLCPLQAGQKSGNVSLISRRLASGAAGNGDSSEPAVNGGTTEVNGLQIAFSSLASNLVVNDTNGVSDVFVRDFSTPDAPVTRRVSVSNTRKAFNTIQFANSAIFPFDVSPGTLPANNPAPGDSITLNDGINPAVTFTFGPGGNVPIGATAAVTRDNLVDAINAESNLLITAEGSNSPSRIFAGTVTSGFFPGISLMNEVAGEQGNQPILVNSNVIYVAYKENFFDLNGSMLDGGIEATNDPLTEFVEQGTPTGSLQPTIDRSGALIAYRSLAQNLSISLDNAEWIRPLTNYYSNVFLYDRDVNQSGTFDTDGNTDNQKISINRFGYPTTGLLGTPSSGSSRLPTLSADGGSIAFASDGNNVGGLRFGATNVLPLDDNEERDVYLYIRDINRTTDPGSSARPTVTVSSPASGDVIYVNETTSIEALVAPINASNTVTVEFYINGVFISSDNASPYIANWTPEEAGEYTIVARATEANVGTSVSTSIVVSAEYNTGAFVTITSPIDGNGFAVDTPITVTAEAGVENTTGTITQVQFFQNETAFATDTTAPYTATFTPSSTGQVTITARATATTSSGSTTTVTDSISISIAVNPPTIALASPLSGDTLTTGNEVTLAASASSSVASISQVEFLVNGVSVGVDTTYPYTTNYTPTSAGTINVQAYAIDSNGIRVGDSAQVTVADSGATITLTSPAVGTQFSIYDNVTLAASVSTTQQIRSVEFFANGSSVGNDSFAPYQVTFSTDTPNNYLFTAQATLADGTKVTSAAVATQGLTTPLATASNFINQVFLDFTGISPPEATLTSLRDDLQSGAITKADVVIDVMNTSQGQAGTSIVGAYQTVLRRFPDPTEYQAALLDIDTTGSSGGSGNFIDISLGDTVSGTINNSGFGDAITYRFTASGQQAVFATISSPNYFQLQLRDANGTVIATTGNGYFYELNPSLTATVGSAGTYFLDVDGIGSGTYSLTLSGTGGASSGGVSGSFTLTTLLNDLFSSSEYNLKFGPLPNVDAAGSAGPDNRRAVFKQLYISKYGGEPSNLQQDQGQLRINALGGVTPFTEVFITETQLDNGSDLITGTGRMRPSWQSILLILALFNEQPTVETINEFSGMSLYDQINAMLADERYTSRFSPVDSILFGAPITGADDWINSPWMGYISSKSAPWYYHITMHWLYTEAATSDSVWFFNPTLGWFWTSSSTYPFLYSIDYSAWLYYLPGQSDPNWLYNTSTSEWFALYL